MFEKYAAELVVQQFAVVTQVAEQAELLEQMQ
jgi:hypothetical protein